jgi:methylated-DNA-[protein]-cysteine S-methyltransferase
MRYCEISSPIGRLLLAGDGEGLRRIAFQSERRPAEVAERRQLTEEPFREAIAQLDSYFAGRLRRFDLALAPEGTPFQKEVWSALRAIPYGETVSYSELARRIGRPAVSRAVGAANGRNPIPIVIPCHRVIGANGSLTGFGGGLVIKRRLLELEGGCYRAVILSEAKDLLFPGSLDDGACRALRRSQAHVRRKRSDPSGLRPSELQVGLEAECSADWLPFSS